jgi:hypothetical protein
LLADRNTRRLLHPTTNRRVRCAFRDATVRPPRRGDRSRRVHRNCATATRPARNVHPVALGLASVPGVRDPGEPLGLPACLALLLKGACLVPPHALTALVLL